MRALTWVEELRVEGSLVPNRRGELYRLAADELEKLRKDAERYRRLRENWVNCSEINLHGRLSVIDAHLDRLLQEEKLGGTPALATLDSTLNPVGNDYDLVDAQSLKEID